MSLNVIGLISGGKDSLFSLAHCIQNGHKIVALANLYPGTSDAAGKDKEGPDLDSLMYQTVGHSIIPLYEEALGVPLYREPIAGTALQKGRYYETGLATAAGDEIEDMYSLVKKILMRHPEANALSAGAILSTYQRTRVESVAIRLGLTPLAYLWQYPALPPPASRPDSLTGLLDDMSISRCNARIIKIASGGIRLNMSFSNVSDPSTRTKLVSGMTPFFSDAGQEFWLRGAVLGEGGEYETLALDGPGMLWKKRIQVDSFETYETEGGAAYVRLGHASLVERQEEQAVDVPVPLPLDKRFAAVQNAMATSEISLIPARNPLLVSDSDPTITNQFIVNSHFVNSSNTIQLYNLSSPGDTAAEQLGNIITALPHVLGSITASCNLPEGRLEPKNLTDTKLLLCSMEDFASVNQIYAAKLWPQGLPNPPARMTIAAPLPQGVKVSMSLVFDTSAHGALERRGLHVQSRSYWAPANIGPYSQAISVPILRPKTTVDDVKMVTEIVHLAGQIPLVPATMAMLDCPFAEQAILALQHLWRVAQERGIDVLVGTGVAFLPSDGSCGRDDHNQSIAQRAREAALAWTLSHHMDENGRTFGVQSLSSTVESKGDDRSSEDNDDDVDVWDLQQRHRGFGVATRRMTVGEHLHQLPNRNILLENQRSNTMKEKISWLRPPFVAAEVTSLPRNAPIEWWSEGLAGLTSMAGSPASKVLIIPIVSQNSWALCGIAVEAGADSSGDEVIESEKGLATMKQRSLCIFATLTVDDTIDVSVTDSLPRSLEDLIPYIAETLESSSRLRYELVTAHSFVSLRSRSMKSLHGSMQLLQNSCTIPCERVWSGSPCTGSSQNFMENSTERVPQEHERGISEAAAVVVMRIEAVSD